MGWYGWGGTGAFGWIGGIGMVLFWFGLIALVVWGISAALRPRAAAGGPPPEDLALQVLRERYARGEITDAEYEQARGVLTGKRS